MEQFEKEVLSALRAKFPNEEFELSQPKDPSFGDLALACHSLARKMKKNPNEVAEQICRGITPKGMVKKIETRGPYLNFFVDKQRLCQVIVSEILAKKQKYGAGKRKNEKVMVEFFQANTHKAVHIGHVRNMCLGIALSNILEFCGFKVVRANYQGDIGPHVVKCLWGLLHFNEKPPKENRLRWLGEIYKRAHGLVEGNEGLELEIREMTKRLYENDPKLVKLWAQTRKWCIDDFQKIYKDFKVKFDILFFESEVEAKGKTMVLELQQKGVAKESEGAVVMDLEKYGLGIFVLLRNDGVALYSTKDLRLAREKFEKFKIDRNVYVVGSEQEMYFKQLFKTLEIIGFAQARKCYHLSYGLVMLPEGKMSSRVGTVVLYEDLKERIYEAALKSTLERHKDWSKEKVEQTKKLLAFSALKFGMVSRETNRPIIFDWDKALDFEGETGPYVQYAHARICSILRKYNESPAKDADFRLLNSVHEEKIIMLLSQFKAKVIEAAESYRPYIVAKYLLELAQAFNEFYHECPILKAEDQLRNARLLLIVAVKQVLCNGLNLLGIEAPEMM